MKAKILFIILLVLPICLFAQFTEYNTLFWGEYCDSPHAEIKQNGIGNFGFDSENSVFNPKFQETKFKFSISSLIEIKSSKIEDDNEFYKSDFSLVPNINLGYKIGKYYFQVSHYYSKYTNTKATNGLTSAYNIQFGYLQYKLINQILQFSISKQVSNNISISAGILTNNFLYSLTGTEYDDSFDLKLNYFEQFQFLSSINIQMKSHQKIYLLFKSQKSNLKLPPDRFEEIHAFNGPLNNNTRVSFPGLVTLGYQLKIHPNLKLSFESINQFLIAREEITYIMYNISHQKIQHEHKIWNPEFVVGLNSDYFSNIELGLLYSIYLNYDNNIRSHNTIPPQSVYETKHPQSVILSAKVNYKKVTLSFNYQYSYAETKFNYGNPNSIHPSKGTFVNSTQYANIRLSIPLY